MKNKYIIENDIIKIILHRRKDDDLITIIDKEDFDKLNAYDGTFYASRYIKLNGKFYVKITLYLGTIDGRPKYKVIRFHRIILNCENNDIVDHINGDTLDNRKSNLRITDFGGNTKNRCGENINNTSGERNVSLINGWYVVQIQVNGKNTVVGKFNDIEQARIMASQARQEYYGDYSGDSTTIAQ